MPRGRRRRPLPLLALQNADREIWVADALALLRNYYTQYIIVSFWQVVVLPTLPFARIQFVLQEKQLNFILSKIKT